MYCSHWHPSKQALKLLALSTILITGSITVFSMAASYLAVRPLDFTAPNVLPIPAQIIFTVELLSVDAVARTMAMDWYPGLALGCDPVASFIADIYFDPNLLDSSSPSFSSLPPFTPAYQLNTSQLCGIVSPVTIPVFRTIIKLLGTDGDPQAAVVHSSFQKYPFDVYTARISMYALDPSTGAYITLNVTCSFGVAVNFEVTPHRTFIGNTLGISPLQIDLQITRSRASKMFVVLVAISNLSGLVTAAFLIISAAALVYPNPKHYSEMFVLPVGVLFAFTSIRANLPGAPAGFGAKIDLFSILPVLVIVTLCSFFLLLVVLYQRLFESGKVKNVMKAADFHTSQPLGQIQNQEEKLTMVGSPYDASISMESPLQYIDKGVNTCSLGDSSNNTRSAAKLYNILDNGN